MEDTFWNDETVLEFIEWSDSLVRKEAIQKFKESKKPKADYEILSVGSNGGAGWSCDKNMFDYYMKQGWAINQVKRLADNEVFTVGDKNTHGVIKKFFVGWAGMEVHYTDGSGQKLSAAEKIPKPKPLFTTEDGFGCYEDCHYWIVNDKYVLDYWKFCLFTPQTLHSHPSYKVFSIEENANQYILQNKPVQISLKEMLSLFNVRNINFFNNPITELFKSKIQ